METEFVLGVGELEAQVEGEQAAELREPRFLERHRRVDADHLLAAAEQRGAGMKADEAGGAGGRQAWRRWPRAPPSKCVFLMAAPTVYLGSTKLPSRTMPHWLSII